MAQTQTLINFRMDTDLKHSMEAVCRDLGMNMTTAFTIFAKKMSRERRIPFDVSVDPFYSPANIAYLEGIVADMKSGKAKFEEHDLIEVDESSCCGKNAHGRTISTGRDRIEKP